MDEELFRDDRLIEGIYQVSCYVDGMRRKLDKFVGVKGFKDYTLAYWLDKKGDMYIILPSSRPIEIPLGMRKAYCSDVWLYFSKEDIAPRLVLVEKGLDKIVGNLKEAS